MDHRAGRADAEAPSLEAYLAAQESKDLLRFLTCGSVDDGKSTLLGRLLYDCHLLFEDQLASLTKDSARYGTTGVGELDLALLVDGLEAEREQGITIDVAYRFFTTDKRKFIVADTPGHEQYTRNMATGASTADAAVVLVDARKGVLTQTRRHTFILSLLGIRHVILAVNKMDLTGWDQAGFDAIARGYRDYCAGLGISDVKVVPVSALTGQNVATTPAPCDWYGGPTLLGHLEALMVAPEAQRRPMRLPVQWVNRPNQDFRGYSGTMASGHVAVGDAIVVLPSGRSSRVARIVGASGDIDQAVTHQAVTLVLEDEIDVSRGDVIVAAEARAEVADQFAASLIWMDDQAMLPGRSYYLRMGTSLAAAQVTRLKHKVDVNSGEDAPAEHLDMNEVGECHISLDKELAFDAYSENPATGGFILIDRITNATVGCGMIRHPLRRAANIHRQRTTIDKQARASLNGQLPCVLWFTGLSGAGKSTIANAVEQRLVALGARTMLLDGDNVRHGLNRDLGFTDEDRVENIRRVGEVAKLMVEAGLVTLVSFISPFRSERRLARSLLAPDEFVEIFVDAPLSVCEARDPKGLYRKARAGEIPNFTGIGSAYEPPENAEITLDTDAHSVDRLAGQVMAYLMGNGYVQGRGD